MTAKRQTREPAPVDGLPGASPRDLLRAIDKNWLLTFVIISALVHFYLLVAGSLDAFLGLTMITETAPAESLTPPEQEATEQRAEDQEMLERTKSEKAKEEEARARAAAGGAVGTTGAPVRLTKEQRERVGLDKNMMKLMGGEAAIKEAPKEPGMDGGGDPFSVDNVELDMGLGGE